jgi:uncharacterized RDD family membrane protein YckC
LAKLILNPTSGARKEIPIGDKVFSIGRDPSNDLVLSDSMVSRRHAIMERREDDYTIRDNNSSNGTMVNGDRVVSDQPLHDGDLIAIGSARLLFQDDSQGDEKAPAMAPPPASKPDKAGDEEPGTTCPGCGAASSSSDRFCRRCGKELVVEKPREVVCGNCGTAVELPAEFCGSCGKPLEVRPGRHQVPTKPRPWAPPDVSERITKPKVPPVPSVPKAARPAGAGRPRVAAPGRRPAARLPAAEGEAAGFWIRFAAYLIDSAILMVPIFVVLAISVPAMIGSAQAGQADPSSAWVALLPALGALLTAVLSIAYPLYFWTSRGATPGKSLLGLKIVTTEGDSPIGIKSAVLRLIGYMINGFIFGIGFLLIALSEDKRGLHDRIAETTVVRRR